MTTQNIWFGKSLKPEVHNLNGDVLCEQCFVSETMWWMEGYIICEKRYEYDSGCTVTLFIITKLTPWSRVLLEKLIGSQLLKNYPAFYGQYDIHKSLPPVPV